MIQGILALVLLGLSIALFFWGRRSTKMATPEDPDVILGLTERHKKNLASEVISEPIAPPTAGPQFDRGNQELMGSPDPTVKPREQNDDASAPAPSPVQPKKPLQREILFLRAPKGRLFGGYELLQSLLSCGLRFGDKRIFHRYEQNSQSENELFSVAAATQSGELNPADMGEFSYAGLSLFLTLNKYVYPSVNFEMMLDTARQLAEDLGGVLLDERQELLTPEKIQKIREKIKEFETSQQTMELFV